MPVITSSYARMTAVFPGLKVSAAAPRSGEGWVTAQELAEGGAGLTGFVGREAAQAAEDYGRPPRAHVAATLALHRYLWPSCLLFTVPWFLRRRVPWLEVGDVAVHPAAGRATVRTRSFLCLPDDPAANEPGARTVPDEAALRAGLRAALAEHQAPVLAAFRPLVRRGPHALWSMATDEITEGLWYIGRLLGEEERAVAELAELLPGDTAPYAGGAGFTSPKAKGTRAQSRTKNFGDVPVKSDAASTSVQATACATRDRLTCCLFYTISPSTPCAGCPRATDPDRIDRRASAA
ncbi:MAG: hypothetical protein QOF98_1301 [Streptomyces sp.]|nr:hypothetical protein [Streptomyces sp.]